MEKRLKKPKWLKVDFPGRGEFSKVKRALKDKKLCTVCVEASCPNLGECWARGTMTIMIMGDICTRNCKFCNVRSGIPQPLDKNEPENVAETLEQLGIKYAVITSVTRDDLDDYGAQHWADVISAVKNRNIKVEVLTGDFLGEKTIIQKVLDAKPYIFSHNLEIVKELSKEIRSNADYDRSLSVLKFVSESGQKTKSSLMIGMGETMDQIETTIKDLYENGVSILAIGQYLQPTRDHFSVKKYYSPEEFEHLKEFALNLGFTGVESAPLVRSSYKADKY